MASNPIRILCYGDSNTWGTIGQWEDTSLYSMRFDRAHRWTGILQAELGDGFEVIEEGLGGRTTIYDNPAEPWKNGEPSLLPCLHSHRPIDLIIIMLGTNDLHLPRTLTEDELPIGISRLVDLVKMHPKAGRSGKPPEILLLSPIEVRPASPEARISVYQKFRGDTGRELSLRMPGIYERIAKEKGCYYLNTQEYASPGLADGIHMDADSHMSLGKAVADYIRTAVFPDNTQSTEFDGSRSQLYLRIQKQLPSVQGMAVHNDRAYMLYDSGWCAVHDLNDRNAQPLDFFPLGSMNEGTPSRDYRNHSNQAMFGTIHHEANSIPLLYVTIGSGIGTDEDGFFYRCAVENITRTTDDQGAEHHHSETLQTICYRPDGIDDTSYVPPCWGCPAFFPDTENGFLYIFSARYRTKRGCVPEGESNSFIITKFPLPSLSDGAMIHLTPKDILDQFVVPSDTAFTQGGLLTNGLLIYTYGCPKHGYPDEIMVFDVRQKKLTAHIRNLDDALHGEELESCAVYNGNLILNTNEGGIYTLCVQACASASSK